MKEFTASRLSASNKLFPTVLRFTNSALTILEPGIFSNKEKSISFVKIASVKIDCPLVGFSSITIETVGSEEFTLTGFYAKEVKEMKELINS